MKFNYPMSGKRGKRGHLNLVLYLKIKLNDIVTSAVKLELVLMEKQLLATIILSFAKIYKNIASRNYLVVVNPLD